jgi:hypothetical protein
MDVVRGQLSGFNALEVLMLRYVLAATLVLAAGAAKADDAITSPVACNAVLDQLAQAWENHKYANKADQEKVAPILTQLQKQCEAGQLAEAQKTAAELKGLVAK